MANTQGSQGSGSGTHSNQDPAQKGGTSQHNQQGGQGKPNDMSKENQSNKGNQSGTGGSQHSGTGSGQHSGGSGGGNR